MADRDAHPWIVALVLSRLSAGSLLAVHVTKVGAGKGTGRRCDGCDQPITATEIENEVELARAVILRLHGQCFSIWQGCK
jgi:hypothetical protein